MDLVDAAAAGAARVDRRGREAVPQVPIVVDVAERVPLRPALHHHHQDVVDVARAHAEIDARRLIAAGRGHQVQRVDAGAARLRAAAMPDRDGERERLPLPGAAGGTPADVGSHVVERAALVLGAPSSPRPERPE